MPEIMKTVVVTGTSSGLGMAITENLLLSGYRVIGISRRESVPKVSTEILKNFEHLSSDLSALQDIHSIYLQIKTISQNIYGLVNNAAIGKDGILPTLHNSDINYQINLNLTSPIILTKYISRDMLSSRTGRIINITSIVANSGYRGLSVYAATKAGLEGFSKSLARELGSRDITVNCIAPGFMATDMTADLSDSNLQRIQNRSALKRFPTPEEVASTVNYILSPHASAITGTSITVDAGNTA